MADVWRYRTLSTREQALVAIGVLLDGHDAGTYLSSDKDRATALSKAASDLAALEPDLRIPLVGTYLRRALQTIKGSS